MPTRQHVFPLDLTMTLASNRVVNEVKEFTTPADRLFVPNAGPFYTESMIIKTASGRLLQPITEYKLLYMNEDATLASNRNVCTVIQILNESINAVHLDYRVPGGEYGDTVAGILQELGKTTPTFKQIDWKTNVYNKPTEYPPAPHFHRGEDFTDWDKVWVELDGIRKAIIVGDEQSWAAVFRYFNRRIEFVEGNISNNLLNSVNSTLEGFVTKGDLNQYYNKEEVNRLLDEVSPDLLSKGAGNLLELRDDGLYYGIQAPADLSNLYVDAVDGDDSNVGSRAAPLRTIDAALGKVAATMSNTIHLKIIPEDKKHTHSYFISKTYRIEGGARRMFKPYNHPLIDGTQNTEARKLNANNYWYFTQTVPKVNIWVHWIKLKDSTGANYQEPAKFFNTNGVVDSRLINWIVARPENTDTHVVMGYSYKTIFGGSGKYEFFNCTLTRVVDTDNEKENPDVTLRPAYTDVLANATYWFMSYGGLLEVSLRNALFTYGTLVTKAKANEFGHTQYGIVNEHEIYKNSGFSQVSATGYKGVPFFEIYTSNLNIYNENNYSWAGEALLLNITAKLLDHNALQWLSTNNCIGRIAWLNGVPSNLSVNFPLSYPTIANNPNAYRVVNIGAGMIPNDTQGILDILMWRDGLSDAEMTRFTSGMSYHRIITNRLKTLNLDMEGGGVFGNFVPTGLQVTLYNATNNEITVNQTLGGTNYVRKWLPYSALTLIFINRTEIDIIGGMTEE